MTTPTDPAATSVGGDGWAKTVVEGISEEIHVSSEAGPDVDAAADHDAGADHDTAADHDAAADHGAGADHDADADENEEVSDPGPWTDDDGVEPAAPEGDQAISVEHLVADLERVSGERDQLLDTSKRIQADFENYKKQVDKRLAETKARANDSLIGELLPILDAFDGALANGVDDVVPMRTTFLETLAKQGLERIEPMDGQFDPTVHEAVAHEPDDETDGPMVAEVMRAGYAWKGRVLRPAMVKTRG